MGLAWVGDQKIAELGTRCAVRVHGVREKVYCGVGTELHIKYAGTGAFGENS